MRSEKSPCQPSMKLKRHAFNVGANVSDPERGFSRLRHNTEALRSGFGHEASICRAKWDQRQSEAKVRTARAPTRPSRPYPQGRPSRPPIRGPRALPDAASARAFRSLPPSPRRRTATTLRTMPTLRVLYGHVLKPIGSRWSRSRMSVPPRRIRQPACSRQAQPQRFRLPGRGMPDCRDRKRTAHDAGRLLPIKRRPCTVGSTCHGRVRHQQHDPASERQCALRVKSHASPQPSHGLSPRRLNRSRPGSALALAGVRACNIIARTGRPLKCHNSNCAESARCNTR